MNQNASLSDYLFELRRGTPPARLAIAMAAGLLITATGVLLGVRFTGLAGLGAAITGVSAWARLNQIADSLRDGRFESDDPARARSLRAAGVFALAFAGVGAFAFMYSFVFRGVFIRTGM